VCKRRFYCAGGTLTVIPTIPVAACLASRNYRFYEHVPCAGQYGRQWRCHLVCGAWEKEIDGKRGKESGVDSATSCCLQPVKAGQSAS